MTFKAVIFIIVITLLNNTYFLSPTRNFYPYYNYCTYFFVLIYPELHIIFVPNNTYLLSPTKHTFYLLLHILFISITHFLDPTTHLLCPLQHIFVPYNTSVLSTTTHTFSLTIPYYTYFLSPCTYLYHPMYRYPSSTH